MRTVILPVRIASAMITKHLFAILPENTFMLDLTTLYASFPTIETERCILRAPEATDGADIYQIFGNPNVVRYLGRPAMTNIRQAFERIQAYLEGYENGEFVNWVVVSKANHRVIGTFLYWHFVPQHYRAEIGYILDEAWWGKGIMTEITTHMVDYGFDVIGLNSLEAQIDPHNVRSRALLEKMGFVQEGYFRENYYDAEADEFVDTAVFSLLKSRWKNKS